MDSDWTLPVALCAMVRLITKENFTSATRRIVIVGIPHALQGPGFSGFIGDTSYRTLVENLIRDEVDFVFEEAAGRGPSIAEGLANSLIGPGRYLDFDPGLTERPKHGIHIEIARSFPIAPFDSTDTCESSAVDAQGKREQLWLQRVQAERFEKGLVICGVTHSLSFAFRLRSAGITVPESLSYIPHNKLCGRPHK
jgi:hypothetical protein